MNSKKELIGKITRNNLRNEIIQRLKKVGFINSPDPNNKRLGISKSMIFGKKYVEIIKHNFEGYYIFFHGLSDKYLPLSIDVCDKCQLKELDEFIERYFVNK